MQAKEDPRLTRRRMLQLGAAGAVASSLAGIDALAVRPRRIARAESAALPNIQFDIADHVAPAENISGTMFQFPPVFTLFLTARLARTPAARDQQRLEQALAVLERSYPFGPSGLFTYIAYGMPYFNRLPGGASGELVAGHMPRLLLDRRRYAFEEAVPAPSDVSPDNASVTKQSFNIPLVIEANDLLLTLQSDVREHLTDAAGWLFGSNELAGATLPSPPLATIAEVTSMRTMFVQRGLPRRIAEAEGLPFATRVHPESPMWMGFASQQADSNGPAAIVTFQGTSAAKFTDAVAGDYFADGAVQHLSHVLLDLEQWYADSEPYLERVQHMFRANPAPAAGEADQFAAGGGPAFLPNLFRGRDDARQNAIGERTLGGEQRLGHVSLLQRASRAANGTPLHIRIDGPGLDAMDVPDGSRRPKLQFSAFVPTAEVFERMRRYQSGVDLADAFQVPAGHNGIDRFITTTRRQNFLVPPRVHRAFPLIEFV